mgnify:FL=1|jgi:hypothetical protein
MTAYEALQEFHAWVQSQKPEISEKAKALTESALKEKARRETGCQYCTPDGGAARHFLHSESAKVTLTGDRLHIVATEKQDAAFRINYCPNCGKKLNNRAASYGNDDPLTVEELEEMDGDPLFVVPIVDRMPEDCSLQSPRWGILSTDTGKEDMVRFAFQDGKTVDLHLSIYNEVWIAFAKKPSGKK